MSTSASAQQKTPNTPRIDMGQGTESEGGAGGGGACCGERVLEDNRDLRAERDMAGNRWKGLG
eukprot:1325723-Pleurochrysis_carterae.AAC.1